MDGTELSEAESDEAIMVKEVCSNSLNISPSSLLTKMSETYEGSGDSSFDLQEENSTPDKNIGVRKYRPKQLPSGSDNSSESDYISYSFINMEAVSFLKTPDGHVDKFVTDENLLDSLFSSCDMAKSGKVQPSHLVDCVHSVIMPMHHDDEMRFMEGLGHLLDPEGKDEEVDVHTFRTAFTQWITKYQLENMDNSVFLDKGVSGSLRHTSEDDAVPQWYRRKRHKSSGLDVSMFSYGSLEGNGGDMSLLEGESTDLHSKIEDLNFQIRKLTEQNSKLKSQLELTEESNSQLVLDLDRLNQQIKGSQVISQRNRCVRQENQELKTTLTSTEKAKLEIQSQYEHLEYERGVLETRVTNLEDELSQTQKELEQCIQQKNDADEALKDFKEMLKAIQTQLTAHEMELSERVQKCEQLEKLLQEEQKEKQTLKTEKAQLENQILETRQELMVFQSQEQVIEEFGDRDLNLTPLNQSTPQKGILPAPISLHSELKCLVNQESNLPSPLCGTPLFDRGKDDNALFDVKDEQLNHLTHELKAKKEAIKRKVHQIFVQKDQTDQLLSEDHLCAEMDSLLEYVTSVANEKLDSEERITKLRHIIKRIRDDNAKLIKKHAETLLLLQKQPESQPDVESLRQENDRLASALSKANNNIQVLEGKIDKCKTEFNSMQDKVETVAHALQKQTQQKQQLETELHQQQIILGKLEEDLQIKEECIIKLELELHQTEEELLESRKDFCNLENTLAMTMSEHHTDLKGIMSLVSCSDCSSNESQDFVDQLQGQSVKDKIGRQLSELQTELAKQKSKVASLETLRSDQYQQLQNVTDLAKNAKNTLLNHSYPTSLFSALCLELDKRLVTSTGLDQSQQTLHSPNTTHYLFDKKSSVSTQTELPRTPTGTHHCNKCVITTDIGEAHSTPKRSCSCSQHFVPLCIPTINTFQTVQRLSGEDSDSSCDSVFYTAVPSPEPYSLCASAELSPIPTPTSLPSEDDKNQPSRFISQLEAAMQPPNIAENLDENCNNDIRSSTLPPNITFWHTKSSQDRQAEAQKMADMLATSYARPAQQISSEILSSQTDEDGYLGNVPPRKLSPRPKRRMQTDRNKRVLPVNVSDLLNGNVDNVELSETDKEVNLKLLEESRRASERFKNRKGRRTGAGLTGPTNRSQSLSPRNINTEDDSEPPVTVKTNGLPEFLPLPTCSFGNRTLPAAEQKLPMPDGDTDRVVRQKHDEDEEEIMQMSDDQMERQETDVDRDIKADILKGIGPIQPDQSKPSAQLEKLRKVNKLKRGAPLFRMPELAEASETESAREAESPCESDASMIALQEVSDLVSKTDEMQSATHEEVENESPLKNKEIKKDIYEEKDETIVSNEPVGGVLIDNNEDNNEEMDNTEEKSVKRLSSLLPDSVLRSLGLSKTKEEPAVLTEKEVEEKFLNVSLALKINKFTLDKRVYLHERQRNLAESNVDEELHELHRIVQTLDPLCKDLEAKDCLNKIRSHLEYLNASSQRLCCKAELLGATQQENRLSVAADVMITHVENLKKMYEKEHSELEEARKLLEENKVLFRGNSPTSLSNDVYISDSRLVTRRSLTLAGNPKIRCKVRLSRCCSESDTDLIHSDESGRRRASVATFIGYNNNQGGQSLTKESRRLSVQPLSTSFNLEDYKHEILLGKYTTVRRSSTPYQLPLETSTQPEDARSRFSSAIAATAARNKLSTMFLSPKRDGAVDSTQLAGTTSSKRKSQVSFSDETSSSTPTPSPTQKDLIIMEEESFKRGFEEGVRVQLSQELIELRNQQKGLCDNLDDLMDKAEDEDGPVKTIESLHVPSNAFLDLLPFDVPWYQIKKLFRLTITGVMFIFAILTLLLTILPIESCQGSMAAMQRPGKNIGELLHQFVQLKHEGKPPL